jgi:hypothetical protein
LSLPHAPSKPQLVIIVYRLVFVLGIFFSFLFHPVKWMAFPSLPQEVQVSLAPHTEAGFYASLPLGVRALAASISLLPAAIAALQFMFLYRLFGSFQQGRFFDSSNVRLIRHLGALLLLSVPADILARFLMDLAFNLARAPGQKTVSVGLSTGNIQAAAIGLIVLVAGAIIERGCALAEENRFTI